MASIFGTLLLEPFEIDSNDFRRQRKHVAVLKELIQSHDAIFNPNSYIQYDNKSRYVVKHATVDRLIEKLFDESYAGIAYCLVISLIVARANYWSCTETEFVDIIFMTHNYFTSSSTLQEALIDVYSSLLLSR